MLDGYGLLGTNDFKSANQSHVPSIPRPRLFSTIRDVCGGGDELTLATLPENVHSIEALFLQQ
jgi:hypothetical protein